METLRKGGSPKITQGENAGDSIALDHVLPRSLVPELAARFYNLEAIPSKKNLQKSDRITARELSLARRWHREGLLSANGLRAIEAENHK
jgi:5-methylcytosine-specific restriction endonuclease McrA